MCAWPVPLHSDTNLDLDIEQFVSSETCLSAVLTMDGTTVTHCAGHQNPWLCLSIMSSLLRVSSGMLSSLSCFINMGVMPSVRVSIQKIPLQVEVPTITFYFPRSISYRWHSKHVIQAPPIQGAIREQPQHQQQLASSAQAEP